MAVTAFDIFHSTIQKTHDWLRDLMAELNWDDPNHAYMALRATLHTLRDRLTVAEAAQLAAQMPMLVRGFYYEGWKPTNKPERIRHVDDFLEHVESELRTDLPGDTYAIVRGVFAVLEKRLSEGEISDVIQLLPKELRELWP
jgi:uncharacterized protein (DUF2267 family)